MKQLVLDASAGVHLVRPEERTAQVVVLVTERLVPGIAVPTLFWLEVANALSRRHGYSGAAVLEALHELEALPLQTVEMDRTTLLSVIDLVERHALTAYDAAYLALAISLNADLATGDRRLALAAGTRAVVIGGDAGIAEERATYRPTAPTWPAWSDAGAYLADLRATLAE